MRAIVLCALCLMVAGAALHGCKVFGPGSPEPMKDDAAIAARVQALIAEDQELSGAGIRVFVLEGNVTLSGTVSEAGAKLRLLTGAKGLKGVKSVGDNLEVRKTGVR